MIWEAYGRLIDAGWTLPACRALTWPETLNVLEGFNRRPPLAVCVRAYLGIKTPEASSSAGAHAPDASPPKLATEADCVWIVNALNGGKG